LGYVGVFKNFLNTIFLYNLGWDRKFVMKGEEISSLLGGVCAYFK